MNLFDFGFGKVSEVVNSSISESTPTVIMFSIIGLLIGVGIVFLLIKKGSAGKGKLFRIIYSILIPLFCLSFAFSFSVISSAEKFFVKEVRASIVPMTNMSFPAFQLYLGFKWPMIEKKGYSYQDVLKRYSAHVKFSTKDKDFIDTKKAEFANYLVPRFVRWGIESVLETAREVSIEKNDFNNSDHDNILLFAKHVNITIYGKKYWAQVEQGVEDRIREAIAPYYAALWKWSIIFVIIIAMDVVVTVILGRRAVVEE